MRPKPTLAAAALALIALIAPGTHAAGLVGVWHLLTEGGDGGGQRKAVLTITKDGEALSGYIKGERGEGPIGTITVDGDSFSFVVEMDVAYGSIDLDYNGTVSDDSIEGTIDTPLGVLSFRGTRSTPDAQEVDAAAR